MASSKECMSHARECVRLARLTDNRTVRDQLLDMAQRWTAAAQSERQSDHARGAVAQTSPANEASPPEGSSTGNVKQGSFEPKRR